MARAAAALQHGRGAEALDALSQALATPGLRRDDELAARCAMAEAWLLRDDVNQAAAVLGRPPDVLRERIPPARLSGALAPARPACGAPRRSVARHRAPRPRPQAGGTRARFARHRPGPLRARRLLPPGRRPVHRPRTDRQGHLRAERRRRSPVSRAVPLAARRSWPPRPDAPTKRRPRCGRPSTSPPAPAPTTCSPWCAATRRTSR